MRGALLFAPVVLLLSLVLPVRPASAHPLDVYLQGAYLTLSPTSITVEIDLSPGVLVAPRVLPQLDTDGDHAVADAEGRSYLGQAVRDAELIVDDQPVTLTLTQVDVPPYLTLQAGYGTLRVVATGPVSGASAGTGQHRLFFRNGLHDDKAAYQVNAFVAKGAPVVLGAQQRDPTQRQATISYRVDPSATPSGSTPSTSSADQDSVRSAAPGSRLAGFLQDRSLSVWAVLVAVLAAAFLGALHALTPGHAKTLIAAYLVGSGGTVRDAATLGAVVTVTHTASVIGIGLLALLASRFLLPGVLVPALEVASGLLVLTLGVRLLVQRWPRRARPAARPRDLVHNGAQVVHERATAGDVLEHDHPDDHAHDRSHEHGHAHGGTTHTHALPAEGLTARSLVTMGVSGGLVPCPEALGVMVLAVGVHRTVLGLGLIVSFSVGLAAVLIGLGVLLVRSRTLLTRLDGVPAACSSVLPLVSAAVVTVLGAGLVLRVVGANLPL